MRIGVCSDLHLEFGPTVVRNESNIDVLVLAGDISVAKTLHKASEEAIASQTHIKTDSHAYTAMITRNFLNDVSESFPHVVYVAGNHEFYHGKFHGTLGWLREECAKYGNIHFLENEVFELGDYKFLGATLWTSMNNRDPLVMHNIRHMMNDFKLIRDDERGYIPLSPARTEERHFNSVRFIKEELGKNKDSKCVVVTHHAPSSLSVHPRFAREHTANFGYYSNLEDIMLDNANLKVWCHGHTHTDHDYMVGTTRVVCNPRGYVGYEVPLNSEYDPKVIDV